jgi:hypothetical protein
MALFTLATGVQPSEYKALTLQEYKAFIHELEERNK